MKTNTDTTFEAHPAASMFPMIDDDAFAALVADIREHGQREPVLVVDGQLVDGRNRLRACKELGIEPKVREVSAKSAGDVHALVMSLNFHRRHLKPHEKGAALAAFMERVGAKKQQGKRTDKAKGGTSATLAEVADKLGVPEATARFQLKAAEDYKAAAPEMRAKVDAGEITPKQALKLSLGQKAPHAEQREEKSPTKTQRQQQVAEARRHKANELLGHIDAIPSYCEHVSIDVLRSNDRLRQHWLESCRDALRSLRDMVKKLENINEQQAAVAATTEAETW